ncbi:hypothetical protein DFJ58DRAFT_916027 [Suillus subalutaceus]|uniref:uncharacterized protein n=1 Tax=Suillus subalutaceus TaxID=48586 RepID=UPI001B866295|nr:uncharacterized protein DFJ58DRAFT_916027 [Suillus subalutaceus]KAG1843131.1 hypothetical protein DFJ58DRAFT_916027 [Suillus subalutaceus]
MQKSTTSPSAAMYSTDNDCVTSQHNIIEQTAAPTHTLNCGRHGCPVVFVYDDGTDWPTINCLIDEHYPVCTGGFYELAHSYPPFQHPHHRGPQQAEKEKEGERKEDLENDEYTEDVQPTSVWCRGCQKAISLDKRSRYYPGLWVKHRGKCPGILKMEKDKLALRRDWIYSSNPESAAGSFDMSDENWEEEEEEDKVMGFSMSNVRLRKARWEREAR